VTKRDGRARTGKSVHEWAMALGRIGGGYSPGDGTKASTFRMVTSGDPPKTTAYT